MLVWPSFHHWGLEPLRFLVNGLFGENTLPEVSAVLIRTSQSCKENQHERGFLGQPHGQQEGRSLWLGHSSPRSSLVSSWLDCASPVAQSLPLTGVTHSQPAVCPLIQVSPWAVLDPLDRLSQSGPRPPSRPLLCLWSKEGRPGWGPSPSG